MKKYYYGWGENGYEDAQPGQERYIITVPNNYAPEDQGYGVSAETGGYDIGGDDIEADSALLNFIAENMSYFEDMEPDEVEERIQHLSEEWGVSPEDLEHLR